MSLRLDPEGKELARAAARQVWDLHSDGQQAAVAVIGSAHLAITDLHYWEPGRQAGFERAVAELVEEHEAHLVAFAAYVPDDGIVWGLVLDLREGVYPLRWRPQDDRLQFYDGKMQMFPEAPGWHLTQELAESFGVTGEAEVQSFVGTGPYIGVLDKNGTDDPVVLLGVTRLSVLRAAARRLAVVGAGRPLTEEVLADEVRLADWHLAFRHASTEPRFVLYGPEGSGLAEYELTEA